MIFNLDPLDAGLPALPTPPAEPFHPSCRMFSAARIQRRVRRLLQAGEAMSALALVEDINRIMPGLFIVHLHD